jgi:hypothetical protein
MDMIHSEIWGAARKNSLAIFSTLLLLCEMSSGAYSQEAQPHVVTRELPRRYRCIDVLELEKLRFESIKEGSGVFKTLDTQLALDYFEIVGWIEGFITAENIINALSNGNIANGTTRRDWMIWIYSYCRSNPSQNIVESVLQLFY